MASPILVNVFLHEVLDTWFERDVKPRLRDRAHLIRYADDAVLLFEAEDDARRVMAVLPKRFGKYGLILRPDRTRLLPFQRPPKRPPPPGGASTSQPSTFDLLGSAHYWGRSRRGNWAIMRSKRQDDLGACAPAVEEVPPSAAAYRAPPSGLFVANP